jgi:glyoxylase-like metal-dependent hydrolase (beta-lactamase superfamily II)
VGRIAGSGYRRLLPLGVISAVLVLLRTMVLPAAGRPSPHPPQSTARPDRTSTRIHPFTDTVLSKVRAAASAVPGDLPHSLRYLEFAWFKTPLSAAVDGAGDTIVEGVYTVFQIRYSHGWVMVDAGVDRDVETDTSVTIDQDRYRRVQEALAGANLIVVTHEHHDHIAGVIHTPARDAIASKTVLTRAQVNTLLRPLTGSVPLGSSPLIQLTPRDADRYLVIDYEQLYPIAPGVVLLKAPGHTPGSQMVYVRLASGQEVLLVGDIAWFMAGIERRLQKPQGVSREMGEDRTGLQGQLDWLSGLTRRENIVLANCHDAAWLRSLVRRAVLKHDLDLGLH